MLALTGAAAGVSVIPVAIKAVGELHRLTVLKSNSNNVLARQGAGSPTSVADDTKLARQRAGGIRGGLSQAKPSPKFLDKVPKRGAPGDNRRDYEVGGLGNATSSRGQIDDVLDKVPRRTVGANGDYKRANRPIPSRLPGYGNQSYGP